MLEHADRNVQDHVEMHVMVVRVDAVIRASLNVWMVVRVVAKIPVCRTVLMVVRVDVRTNALHRVLLYAQPHVLMHVKKHVLVCVRDARERANHLAQGDIAETQVRLIVVVEEIAQLCVVLTARELVEDFVRKDVRTVVLEIAKELAKILAMVLLRQQLHHTILQ